jgi:RimJ/RimL family protein N-acetyltransferase
MTAGPASGGYGAFPQPAPLGGAALEIAIDPWKLRAWRAGDEAALARYANNRNVSMWLRDAFPYPYSHQDALTWVHQNQGKYPVTNFAIASAYEPIGGIGLELQTDIFHRSAEIGYWLREQDWGKGIMTRAVRAAVSYAFATFDIVRIHAMVFEGNYGSARVLQKAGFLYEGRLHRAVTKDGRTIDAFLYALVRQDASTQGKLL